MFPGEIIWISNQISTLSNPLHREVTDFIKGAVHLFETTFHFLIVKIHLLTQIKETRGIFSNFIELKHRK